MNNRLRLLTVAYLLSALPVMLTAQDCDPNINHAAQARQAVSENRLASAVDSYTCAITLNPDNADLYGGRGLALMLSGDVVGGVSDYQRYEDLTGELAPFMTQQINRFFVTAPPPDAVVVQTADDSAQGNYQLGLTLQAAGAYDRAILAYNRAISLDPDNPVYYGARGMTYLLYDSPDLARQDFQRYEQLTGTPEPFMRQLMPAAQNDVMVVGAQQTNPPPPVTSGEAESYYRRALHYQQSGELDLALFDYGIALSLAPQNPDYYAARGLAYVLAGQPQQALADYNQYRELTGDFQNFMVQQIPALQRALAEQRMNESD